MKSIDAMKETLVKQGFSQPVKVTKKNCLMLVPKCNTEVKEGKDLLDPIWSVDVYKSKERYVKSFNQCFIYLDGGPERSFVFEELQPIQDL